MLVDKDEATGTDTDSDARTGLLYIPSALPEMLSYNILFVCSSLSSFLNLVILGLIPDIGLRSLKDSWSVWLTLKSLWEASMWLLFMFWCCFIETAAAAVTASRIPVGAFSLSERYSYLLVLLLLSMFLSPSSSISSLSPFFSPFLCLWTPPCCWWRFCVFSSIPHLLIFATKISLAIESGGDILEESNPRPFFFNSKSVGGPRTSTWDNCDWDRDWGMLKSEFFSW